MKNGYGEWMVSLVTILLLVGAISSYSHLQEKQVEAAYDRNIQGIPKDISQQTTEQKARISYAKYLRDAGGLSDFTIEGIKVLDEKSLEYERVKRYSEGKTLIYAWVQYSVRFHNVLYDEWIYGNGSWDEKTNWVKGKLACVEFEEIDGEYFIHRQGTGW